MVIGSDIYLTTNNRVACQHTTSFYIIIFFHVPKSLILLV